MKNDQVIRWEVLSSKPCMRVLRLLVRSSVPLHERLIARKLGMRGGHLHRTLQRLVDVEYLKRVGTQHKVFYSATEKGLEAWKEHKTISTIEKFGLPKALEKLEAKLKEIDEKYPNRERLSDEDRHIFACEVIFASGEAFDECFRQKFIVYVLEKLPKYMKLVRESYQIMHPSTQ